MQEEGLLYNCGKSKVMHYGENKNTLIMSFLDSVSSYTYNKNERIPGTGVVRCDISSFLFEKMTEKGFKTHYIGNLTKGKMLVEKIEMIKLEIIPRNYAAGSMVRNYPVLSGTRFDPPILKLDLKYTNDPMLNDDYILALGIATKKELEIIKEIAYDLNRFLTTFFLDKDLLLVDFKFEVGRNKKGEIIIGDEISPDGMRVWDKNTYASLDKDVFRLNKGDLVEAYRELERRLLD